MSVLNTIFLTVILSLGACKSQEPKALVSADSTTALKQIEFGFNTTYLASSPKFEVALEQIANDGITKIPDLRTFHQEIERRSGLGLEPSSMAEGTGL